MDELTRITRAPTDVTLTKTRAFTTTVEINCDFVYESDASWKTSDGYIVHRTTRQVTAFGRAVNECMQRGTEYWVRQRNGYLNGGWTSLAEARETIAHLRRNGR